MASHFYLVTFSVSSQHFGLDMFLCFSVYQMEKNFLLKSLCWLFSLFF